MNLTCKFCPLSFLFSKKKKKRQNSLLPPQKVRSSFRSSWSFSLFLVGHRNSSSSPPLLLCIYSTLDSPSLLSYSSCFLHFWKSMNLSMKLGSHPFKLQFLHGEWNTRESGHSAHTGWAQKTCGGSTSSRPLHLSHTHRVAIGHCSLLDSSM